MRRLEELARRLDRALAASQANRAEIAARLAELRRQQQDPERRSASERLPKA